MMKPEKAVIDTTIYISVFTVIFTVLMHAVFLMTGHWTLSVLWGSLLGTAAAIGNFFVRGLAVQKAVTKDEKEARNIIQLSYTLRLMALVAICAVGLIVKTIFHPIAVVVPLIFPQIAIMLYSIKQKKEGDHS